VPPAPRRRWWLYEAAGLHDLAQEFTDELDRAIPEVDWELW